MFNTACSSFGNTQEVVPSYVDIDVDSITYRTGTSCTIFHLRQLKLFPTSCRGLRWCLPSELHLSLQAKPSQGKGGVGVQTDSGIISYIEEEKFQNNQDILVNKIKQCQNQCYCAGCGRPIFTSNG